MEKVWEYQVYNETKKCPKCGRLMFSDFFKLRGGWIIRYQCFCGHQEEASCRRPTVW